VIDFLFGFSRQELRKIGKKLCLAQKGNIFIKEWPYIAVLARIVPDFHYEN